MAYTWQYYDLVLLGVGGSMAVGAVVGLLTALSLQLAVIASGLVAVAIMGHGMFVNGPVDAPEDLTEEVDALN
ncbi:hypothetical protein [Halostella salina]|uniref:hypothetical protein n=1 Tax=Halostella salina TaxID=1547897 RepID=UPI000EF8402C|nr:hypothetical protein [Halostella salina]